MASEDNAYITYDISGKGFEAFRTYVGKDEKGNGFDNGKVQFEIYVDGVLTASSGDMQYPDMKELSFELPPDAGELKLVAKAPGSHFATGCCFGNPVFTKKATPGEMTLSTIPDGKNPNPAGVYTFRGTAYADASRSL